MNVTRVLTVAALAAAFLAGLGSAAASTSGPLGSTQVTSSYLAFCYKGPPICDEVCCKVA